jgi:eukaryotic-like serine/threonine-protein kinase
MWRARGSRETQRVTAKRPDGAPGRLIAGRYRLRRLLGTGGMGAVWLALDEVLARPVAIKELTVAESVMSSDVASERTLCEARAAALINHPGVVRVHDVATEGGRPWIVMEALAGPTLAQVIRSQGRLAVGRVVDIAVQLVDALRAVHDVGLVHRDVKPTNVQLSGTGRVVLIDFGLACRVDGRRTRRPAQPVGSPPYLAPEVIEDGRFGPASDLFALGATLYAAVEGRQPFELATPFETLEAIKNEPAPPPRNAGRLRPLIEGLLVKDPQQRLSALGAHAQLTKVRGHAAVDSYADLDRSTATGLEAPPWVPATAGYLSGLTG